jgi:hypothetical protein
MSVFYQAKRVSNLSLRVAKKSTAGKQTLKKFKWRCTKILNQSHEANISDRSIQQMAHQVLHSRTSYSFNDDLILSKKHRKSDLSESASNYRSTRNFVNRLRCGGHSTLPIWHILYRWGPAKRVKYTGRVFQLLFVFLSRPTAPRKG